LNHDLVVIVLTSSSSPRSFFEHVTHEYKPENSHTAMVIRMVATMYDSSSLFRIASKYAIYYIFFFIYTNLGRITPCNPFYNTMAPIGHVERCRSSFQGHAYSFLPTKR
jgi:hypothetical protein